VRSFKKTRAWAYPYGSLSLAGTTLLYFQLSQYDTAIKTIIIHGLDLLAGRHSMAELLLCLFAMYYIS